MVLTEVLKKMASSELPTTMYMGRRSATVISGTMNGPPPKPNIDESTAMRKPPKQPTNILTLNSCPQNSTFISVSSRM